MEIKSLTENLKVSSDKIKYDEPMKSHTTFKIGGLAECFIKIDNINELEEVLKFSKKNNIKVTIIGNGSNILVTDKGIKGFTLNIQIKKIEKHEQENKIQMIVGAGEKIGKIAQYCLKEQITGMEELSGIPGTIRWSYKNECWCTWKRNKRHCKKC